MKTILTFLFLSVLFLGGHAQDLIVTHKNDTLNCKITSEKPGFIYFNYMHEGEFRKTMIAKSDVKEYIYQYFDEPEIPQGKYKQTTDYQHFRLSLNGGPSYRTAKVSGSIPGEYQDYMKDLKKGMHISGDVAYFVNETVGLGLKFSRFTADNEIQYGSESLNDNIAISFFGPMLSTLYYSANRKNALFSNIAMGYLGYRDQGEANGTDMEIKGSTFGLAADLGYQIGLSDRFSLGITLSYTIGTLSKFEVSNGVSTTTMELDGDEKENLGRLDLSVGLIFHR